MRKHILATLTAGTLLLGCTSGDDTTGATDDTSGGSAPSTESVPTGPAPGVMEAVRFT